VVVVVFGQVATLLLLLLLVVILVAAAQTGVPRSRLSASLHGTSTAAVEALPTWNNKVIDALNGMMNYSNDFLSC
jgi:hypothetical protein